MKKFHFFVLIAALTVIFGVGTVWASYYSGSGSSVSSNSGASKKFTITSTSFKKNKLIPIKYAYSVTADGPEQNISPQLSWKTERSDIKSFALIMYDKHKIAKNWVHWCVTNIPASVRSLKEGESVNMPEGTVTQFNTFGFVGYGGPYPPKGSGYHNYEIWIVGVNGDIGSVDEPMDDQKVMACTLKAFKKAVKGRVVAEGKYKGKYKR